MATVSSTHGRLCCTGRDTRGTRQTRSAHRTHRGRTSHGANRVCCCCGCTCLLIAPSRLASLICTQYRFPHGSHLLSLLTHVPCHKCVYCANKHRSLPIIALLGPQSNANAVCNQMRILHITPRAVTRAACCPTRRAKHGAAGSRPGEVQVERASRMLVGLLFGRLAEGRCFWNRDL